MTVDELRSKLEAAFKPVEYEVEKGAIRQFVRAVDDENPRWQEVVPPTFVLIIGLEQIQRPLIDSFPATTILHGSTELESYNPVRAGDVLTVTTVVSNIRERKGKMGSTAFITLDTDYQNQRQEPVARSRQLIISY
ncbi:MaoC family dehydratase N-terminal domain-containing protein [Chloroflexota bacterium]